MNVPTTLLAHIAPTLANSEENLATEALCFVLNRSTAARTAFVELLSNLLGVPLPIARFVPQQADWDGTIPDLVGRDTDGAPVVFVESKFWAGLTDAQPVGYLRRLQREHGLGLVFVSPANRLTTLWFELARRCEAAGVVGELRQEAGHCLLRGAAPPSLALTSWSAVLAALVHGCVVAGDTPAAEDLRQLEGLCARMEQAGFVPLRGEELTGNVAQRIEDYCLLVDDLTAELCGAGLASVAGLKASASRDYYCRYVWLRGNGGQIAFHSGRWLRVCPTPLWLKLTGPDWKASAAIRAASEAWLAVQPPAAFVDADGAVLFPLTLLTGRERPDVLRDLLSQAQRICAVIPEGQGGTPPAEGEAS